MTTPERRDDEALPVESGREEADTAFVADAPRPSGNLPPESDVAPRTSVSVPAWITVAVIVLFVSVGAFFGFDLDRAGSLSFWVYAIAPTTLVAAFALLVAARDGVLAEWVEPAWGDATRGLLSAALLLGAAVAFLRVVAPAGSARESWTARIYLQLGDPRWFRLHAGLVAFVILFAAAMEEIVWRGLVTRLLAEYVGSRNAWAWAALPYALTRLPTLWALRDPAAGWNPLLVASALALGLVWGGLARASRRLTPSILSHAAFDWCVVMLFRLWGSL